MMNSLKLSYLDIIIIEKMKKIKMKEESHIDITIAINLYKKKIINQGE